MDFKYDVGSRGKHFEFPSKIKPKYAATHGLLENHFLFLRYPLAYSFGTPCIFLNCFKIYLPSYSK